ncbi:MAG: fasciclin domain-containing protein [Planctomycetota bacterium]
MNSARTTIAGLLAACLVASSNPLASAQKTGESPTGATSSGTPQRVVEKTDETLSIALVKETDVNPMLVAFVKTDQFALIDGLEADSRMPLTIFAPAGKHLETKAVRSVLAGRDTQALKNFVYCHYCYGRLLDKNFAQGRNLKMMMGWADEDTTLRVKIAVDDQGRPTVNGMPVLKTVEAANGVLHIIDGVLAPPAADDDRRETAP